MASKAGIERRVFVRVKPAGLVSRTAKIYADPSSPTLDCTVLETSARGASLDVRGEAPIPKRFTFVHGASKKQGRLVWQKGRKIGVAF